ncbi:retropepsin-like aspartic protease family protein [Kordiimonas marina]|uniref:retropepsin-like aspartic protease family protein n=1 Tax=Kordiimonas marina TaxID=2872312 RepID=UPI001FF4E791|nr:TIGR02281 family clan AA aspartic protease [Kordiimonas marina]MCJ9428862.1 TIGR02281 family clan AA aspartic protease [Kordiimonas marina]
MSHSSWQVPDHHRKDHDPGDPPPGDLTVREPKSDKNTDTREIRAPRWGRFLIFVVGLGLLLLGLSLAFPTEGLTSDPYFVRAMIILFIFGGAAAFWSRSSLFRLAKMAGLWIVILFAIVVFYLYRSDFGTRFMTALDPSGVTEGEQGLMLVHRALDGHFWLRADFNGVPVRLMVDTGASNIVLSPEDAKRIGIDPSTLHFDAVAGTANGTVRFARTTVRIMKIGDKEFYNVPVTVNGAEMPGSLFGMTALNKFSSVEFRSNLLLLKP